MTGECAQLMLEGDLCGTCGVHLDGEGDGYPRYCSDDCDPFHDTAPAQQRPKHPKAKTREQLAQSIMDKAMDAIKKNRNPGWSNAEHKAYAARLRALIVEGLEFEPGEGKV